VTFTSPREVAETKLEETCGAGAYSDGVIVLLHGVPETAALWDKVRSHLAVESVALALPGFGCPRPSGFGATKDDYVAWLLDQLESFDQPVDLIGHDWGAGLTYRVATAYGDRIRSWAVDVANVFHPDYKWHEFARIWQTPGDGEAFFAGQAAAGPEPQAQRFESFGVPRADAQAMAAAVDETMGSCILDLYRSAVPNPYADWHDGWGPTKAPGLVLWPTADPFGNEAKSSQVADALGARHEALEGLSHWWPLQAPADTAAVLNEFVMSVA
jgi:pimeloyl-ACP methyl ester carboxylesterase